MKNKKNYHKPIIDIHGNIKEITKYAASGNISDARSGGKRTG